jgi:carbon monoxide dehydrogenase subunit G
MFNLTQIKQLTRTSLLTLLMAGTLTAQSGTAQTTFKFSDFVFKRASACTNTNCDTFSSFHDKTFYTQNGQAIKGAAAFQKFVQQESSAINLDALEARKLDPTKLLLKNDRKLNIYFINEGAGYRNQLKLVTTGTTAKNGMVFYDGSIGNEANELRQGDTVQVGDNSDNTDVVKAGTTLDFQLRANGFNNPNPDVWHADKTKNIDGLQHVIAYEYEGFLVLAWEDLNGGGDKDYNDIVFAIDIGQPSLDAIPDLNPNQAPNAADDTPTTPYNAPVLIDVLANDSDPENQALTITGVDSITGVNTSNGSTAEIVNDNGTQKIRYTPKSELSGVTESFTYTIKDSKGATASASVTVSVGSQQAPNAADDTPTTNYNTSVVIDVLANDSDPENQALTITGVDNITGVNTSDGSTAEIVNDNGRQKIRYTPGLEVSQNTQEIKSFSYTIKDSMGATDTANVSVRVNQKPTSTINSQPAD